MQPAPPLPAVSSVELSLTGKRWMLAESEQRKDVSVVSHLATQRGIDLREVPSWESLANPLTLGEMPRACERILRAVEKQECIGIIGDYDADGITGVAQLIRFFRRKGIEPHAILPHREKHGYGVQGAFIDALHVRGVTLLLTVDTGIRACRELAYAKELGMDAIVLDHHAPHASRGRCPEPRAPLGGSGCMAGHTLAEELPDVITVHPRIGGHSNPHLSGAGVAFTLLRALEKDMWEERDEDIALASVGTVADVVPLLGENRTIVALGLQAMNAALPRATYSAGAPPWRGAKGALQGPIFQLAQSILGERETLRSSHIGFRIAPRVNAAGRIADPRLALEALLQGGDALRHLHTLNTERQSTLERMMERAEEEVDTMQPVLALKARAFHIGIIGLVASRLTERFSRPSIVGRVRAGRITCSLRSVPGYNLIEALERFAIFLASYGGHEQAAGCTLEEEHWEAFTCALAQDALRTLGGLSLAPLLRLDLVLEGRGLTLSLARSLERLEPCGEGNEEPVFLLHNFSLSNTRCVGANGKHLQCQAGDYKAVGFSLGHLHPRLPAVADLACRIGIDRWNGREQVQLFIEDIAQPALVRV